MHVLATEPGKILWSMVIMWHQSTSDNECDYTLKGIKGSANIMDQWANDVKGM